MNFKRSFIVGISIAVSLMLGACAYMPTSGPTAKKVMHSGEQIGEQSSKAAEDLEQRAVIVDMDANVSSALAQRSQRKLFSETWRDSVEPNVIGSGDVLEVTIWEAPPSVLFGGATNAIGASNARDVKLPPQIVNQEGTIQIPFIGAVRASGRAIPQVEKEIASRLSRMANQPQVMVTPLKNNSSNVAVIGDGGLSVNMPLTAKKERVLDAITAVGGKISSRTSIQVTRGATVRSLPLLSITQDPRQNITLRAGDIVSVLNCKKLTRCLQYFRRKYCNEHAQTNPPHAIRPRGNMAFIPNPTMESDALGRTLPSESPDHLFGTQKSPLATICAE